MMPVPGRAVKPGMNLTHQAGISLPTDEERPETQSGPTSTGWAGLCRGLVCLYS